MTADRASQLRSQIPASNDPDRLERMAREADRELVKAIAMDIGKAVAAHIEVQYPAAVTAASSTFLLSVRNCTYNEIIAALDTTDADAIRERLDGRKTFRRKWKAAWRKIRDGGT